MKVRGIVRKLGLEGGIWGLVTPAGETFELLNAPEELKQDGLEVEVEGNSPAADVTIGMVGNSLSVDSFRITNG